MHAEQVPSYLEHWGGQVDRFLKRALPTPRTKPAALHEAMHYGLFGGGKRLRPALAIAAAEAVGGAPTQALPGAAAVECVHAYSLIHDDLPCMDNDEMRRGRPTCHKVYGEAIALLAGDALLTQAFGILAGAQARAEVVAACVAKLAEAAGSRNLVGGQAADMLAEGKEVRVAELKFIHQGKTAAMMSVSLRIGAMLGEGTEEEVERLAGFGRLLGLAFQIVDDILDATRSSEELGKTAGKDVAAGKATYPAVMGLEGARREAARLTRKAQGMLEPFGERGGTLRAIAEFLLHRGH